MTDASNPKVTTKAEIEKALQKLAAHREEWAGLTLNDRIQLIEQVKQSIGSQAQRWVDASLKAKGGIGEREVEAQEWLGGPYASLRNLTLLKQSLCQIASEGKPILPGKLRKGPAGQIIAPVFPTEITDRMLFMGISADVWLKPEVNEANLADHMAPAYSHPKEQSEICLVLGAGNVSSIGPMDAFYKLFNQKKQVILKMHPVNDYLGPIFEEALSPLIERGYLQIVYGDAKEGSLLCNHAQVDEIHITGSDKTHDIIVFGKNAVEQKAQREPLLKKPITSELGNVSPVIVVPGPWSETELVYHAENVVSSVINNAGFNCNATRVVITHAGWPLRARFLSLIRAALRHSPARPAYYPGANQRYQTFLEAHPEAEQFGRQEQGKQPWMLITDLDAEQSEDICFKTEAFCGVFSETSFQAPTAARFMARATEFCNNTLWGTLNATCLVHPKSLEKAKSRQAFEEMVANLRYGTIAINQWAAIGYVLCSTSWGAFPGHDIYEICSGLDVVHNTYMLEGIEKSVVYAPFRAPLKPPYFITHYNAGKLCQKLTRFETTRSLFHLPAVFAAALGL